MPLWLWGVYSFSNALKVYGIVLSVVIHDFDAGLEWKSTLLHLVAAFILLPWTNALDSASLLSAIFDVTTGFDVISK